MPTPKEIQSKLIDAGNDIFYVEEYNFLPESVVLNKKKYYRFCDFILLPDKTENLSERQVIVSNKIRLKFFNSFPQFQTNLIIREIFKSFVSLWKPISLLEIGPSLNPLITKPIKSLRNIILADFDNNTVRRLRNNYQTAFVFKKNGRLKLKNQSIDVIIGIFIFHYDVSEEQAGELFRVLKDNGVLITNVYNRSKKSKKELLNRFIKKGFDYCVFSDIHNYCKQHEYWFLFKTPDKNKLNKAKQLVSDRS